jgi:hypothetical protein
MPRRPGDGAYFATFAAMAAVAGVLTLATVVYAVVGANGRGAGFWIAMGIFVVVALGLLGFAARAARR